MRLGTRVVLAISILAVSLVGCGGSSTPVVNGSGGASGSGGTSGSGGASGTGGSVGGGSGGETVNPGSGGNTMGSGGAAGQSGEMDAASPQDAKAPPADAADAAANRDAAADGGIANCTAGARCRSMRPEPTCMAACPGGTERTCTCDAAGIVVCGACPRPRPDAGAPDATTSDGGGGDARAACPANVRNGGACPMNQAVCSARCPAGPMPETCVCTNRTWRCVARCL